MTSALPSAWITRSIARTPAWVAMALVIDSSLRAG